MILSSANIPDLFPSSRCIRTSRTPVSIKPCAKWHASGCAHSVLRAQGYASSEQLRTARDASARERLAEAAVPPLMRAAAALSPDAAGADSVSGQSAALLRSMLRTLLMRLHGSAGDLSAEVRSLVRTMEAVHMLRHVRHVVCVIAVIFECTDDAQVRRVCLLFFM